MSDPPDDVFSSEPIDISNGINISSAADWESLGFDSQLVDQGRLIFSLSDLDLGVDPSQLVALLSSDLPVVISLENGLDSELDVETTSVELLSENGDVISSVEVEPLTLSAEEQHDETVSLNTGEIGNLTIEVSNADVSTESEVIEVVEGNFSLDVSLPETIQPGENLDVSVTVQNNSPLETDLATLVTNHNSGTDPSGGLIEDLPALGSAESFEYNRTVGSQFLNEGENTVSAFLWSDHIEENLVVVESFEVVETAGVDLIGDLDVDDIELDGNPLWYASFEFSGSFDIDNDGSEDASNVSVELTAYLDGDAVGISNNTWSYDTIEADGREREPLWDVDVNFDEMGEYTFELVIEADGLDEPILIEDTMVVADNLGEASLGVDILNLEDEFGIEQQFDVSIEEESGDPAEELVVEAVVRDEWDATVFEQIKDELPELSLESETLSFNAGELTTGDYELEITANAENASEEVVVVESFEIIDYDSLEIGVSVSAEDMSFGGESDVTAELTSQVDDRNLTSVEVDVRYYNQLDNQVSHANTYSVGTISPGESETIEDNHPITDCWRTEMECLPGADNDTGEYTVEITVDSDEVDDPIVMEDTFQVT